MGKDRLKVSYDMPLPHWNPPCTAHLWGIYDDVILCTGWKYVAPEMFDMDCCPGKLFGSYMKCIGFCNLMLFCTNLVSQIQYDKTSIHFFYEMNVVNF